MGGFMGDTGTNIKGRDERTRLPDEMATGGASPSRVLPDYSGMSPEQVAMEQYLQRQQFFAVHNYWPEDAPGPMSGVPTGVSPGMTMLPMPTDVKR
jgi:hypothetical protein